MSKSIKERSSASHLTNDGQREAFRTLQETSNSTSKVDSDAINQIGSLTSEFISAAKDAAASAETEDERTRRLNDAKEALREARDEIREVNKRSHESQRGFATLATMGALALAGIAISGGLWLLSKK